MEKIQKMKLVMAIGENLMEKENKDQVIFILFDLTEDMSLGMCVYKNLAKDLCKQMMQLLMNNGFAFFQIKRVRFIDVSTLVNASNN